ncbi:MAG: uroporphyrinogen decarboxylase family protein [bacterium]|nr:uroporphyrinogen decarboxylase family protein [bacterium]
MTSREIIQRTLAFEFPERVAHSFEPNDMAGGSPEIPYPDGGWNKINETEWRRKDEWGNLWGRLDATSMGEIVQGALTDLDNVATFPLPEFENPNYYNTARKILATYPDKWHIGYINGFSFSMARKLRRLEQYLIDILLDRERISILHDRIDEKIKVQMLRMKEAGADSVMFAEDWGTQTQTLISPELWRDEFKPRFTSLCAYAHQLGLKVFMHSCGKITAIIPDLVESGIDVLQFDQPRIHGIDTLSLFQEKNKITFWCPVDIQKTLQTKDEQFIRDEVNELLDKLWKNGQGGFIAGYYGDNASIGLEPKWQEIASDEFLKKGVRKI